MKTLNLISVLVAMMTLVSAARAQSPQPPPEFVGVYAFNPDAIEIASAKHELMIFTINKDSNAFVSKLRKQKYACVNIDSRHVKCSIFLKDLQAIDSTFAKVRSEYKDAQLEIFEGAGPAELINDADMLTEWRKSQNATWMGRKFSELFYIQLKNPNEPTLTKMKFVNDRDEKAYFYLADDAIAFQHTERIELEPAYDFVLSEIFNCLLEIKLQKN